MTETSTTPEETGVAKQVVRERRRAVVAASMGNLIEYIDWAVYSALTVVFAGQFFPSDDPVVSVLLSLATFALGFVARPVGSIYFGNLADRRGRKFVLTAAISLTSLGALLIAVLPTYEQIGVAAPVLLLCARLIQGFGAGGEASSAATFVVEIAPPGRRGLYGSFNQMTTGGGMLIAALVGAAITGFFPDDALHSYGWRLAFLLAASLGIVGLYLRRKVVEAEIAQGITRIAAAERRAMRRAAFRSHGRLIAKIFVVTIPATIGNYMFLSHMPTYAHTVTGIDLSTALLANSCALAVYCLVMPFVGMLSDRIGRKKCLLIFNIGWIFVPYPVFSMLGGTFASVFIPNLIAVLFLAFYSATYAAAYNELFPTSIRATASGVPFTLAISIFGGTAPYIMTQFFASGLEDLVWIYVSVAGLIGLVVTLTLPETFRKELEP